MVLPIPKMENPTAPQTEPETEISAVSGGASASKYRRLFLKGLLGTTLGGTLGYQAHPWLLGDRRPEAEALAESWLKRLKERLAKAQRRPGHIRARHPELSAVPSQPAPPLRLDETARDYEVFLQGLGLRHIRPMEMIRPHYNVRGSVTICLPPREVWRNIAPTLRAADELRHRLGSRLIVLSAYRSPAYNAACPGAATQSFHMRNMALDLAFDCSPVDVAKAAEAMRDEGLFRGGIGRYPGFTHIDTRGYKADWG